MGNAYILYNSKAGNGHGEEAADELFSKLGEPAAQKMDLLKIEDLAGFFSGMEPDDRFYLVGGDGTLNHVINAVEEKDLPEKLYFYPAGRGNDFWNDLKDKHDGEPVLVTPYLKDLPHVVVNGVSTRFLNGVGYGIDGYCCEEGDRLRETSDKPVNYTNIAIKGLLYGYHPCGATVNVDGKELRYNKVWLAPTMHGRYYGGGMMCAPSQDRMDPDHKVTLVVMHDSGKLHTLTVFPSIFKGEHVNNREMVDVLEGHKVSVRFDRPCALQIDGETVKGVQEYHVIA